MTGTDRFQIFLTLLLYSLPGLVVGFTLHELAHAVVTVRFGDDTPEREGRITLDPLAHIDPLGFAMLVGIGFGFAKPVHYNPYRIRTSAQRALVSAAGPLTNLVIAVIAGIALRLLTSAHPDIAIPSLSLDHPLPTLGQGGAGYVLFSILYQTMFINIVLFVFNMIPIPPLDGFAVLKGGLGNVLPDLIDWMERNRQTLMIAGIAILVLLPRIGDNPAGNVLLSITDSITTHIYNGPTPFFRGLDSLLHALSNR